MSHTAPTFLRALTPELRLEKIVKAFGSTHALQRASLRVAPGTVHAVLGENGAGKTTLMRIAFGILQPNDGEIWLAGRRVRFRSPADAIDAGIGMVHQHFTNVAAMTVAENIALGGHGLYSRHEAATRVRELASQTRLALEPNAQVERLSVGAQQRLEILKALSRQARILILDEPTAVLAPTEARELLTWLRDFAAQGGSVILITHKLAEALAIADDVTVLRFGRTVLTAKRAGTSADALAAAMLGAAPPQPVPVPPTDPGDIVLRLTSVTLTQRGVPAVVDVNLEAREHDILGIAALEGSGHELLLRAIAHRVQPTKGSVYTRGAVALIPEDRQRDALILGFSLSENVALKNAGRRRGRMNWTSVRARTQQLAAAYDVRASSIDTSVGELSGGNQQKLVLARELSDDPAVIVAQNPTRGLDIRASADVHARLRVAAARGAAVFLYSSDLDEVLALATRIVAVHQGRLTEVPNEREAAGRAMIGLA